MKKITEELGWLEWDKIQDPATEIDIEPYAFDRVEKYHDPQDVQDMFNEYGVRESVLRMNREYLIRNDKYALEIVESRYSALLRCAK